MNARRAEAPELVAPKAVIITLFGASGDLAHRMVLPAIAEIRVRGLMPEQWAVIASAREPLTDEQFRERVRESLAESPGGLPEDVDEILTHLYYATGRFGPGDESELPEVIDGIYRDMWAAANEEPLVVHFLAVPPSGFRSVTRGLAEHELITESTRVVFEKPYGTDLKSFEQLDRDVKKVLREEQIFRIDHFLGKEGVQTIYVLRFANQLFGSEWDRHSVKQVQIDVPEDLDVADRVDFYEQTGAALDMLVTHLFQVVGQVAMEPPFDIRNPEQILVERERALRALRLDPEEVVLGQFEGYRDLEGVPDDSTQDTFVAARVWVDTDRWRGVPFLLRTGKRMAVKAQRMTLVLRRPDGPLFDEGLEPNTIEVNFAGAGAVSLNITVKTPGPELTFSSGRAQLDLNDVPRSEALSPYASLIHDVLLGDRSLFTTADGLRAAFEAFAPLQNGERPEPQPYAPGSWGPAAAAELAFPHRWMLGQ
ncbi:glucose-6-phosphate dehydrogenase [Georgenia sp. Z1344]|uniref:glucose-6-phosphate dehydrogenase n=1 Tax=Georgenia sp. Z1344 TaxID=3416706 RepID=UPI003CF663AA